MIALNKLIYHCIFICFILLVSCAQNDGENIPQNQTANDRINHVKHSDQRHQPMNEDIAKHLANIAHDVPNVNDSVAIVAGPYAVVGIDVDKDLDKSRVGTIKYSVSEALQHDRYGKTAVVIADVDMMERIRLMKEKVQEGYPVQGVVDELAAIVGRVIPDMPIDEDKPVDPDQNKKIIDHEDKDNLEDIEENQSNNNE